MCVVLVVRVFALAVYAPSLMEDFSEVTEDKDKHFIKECNSKKAEYVNLLPYFECLFISLIIHLQVAYN